MSPYNEGDYRARVHVIKKHWNLPTAMVSMIQMLRALDEEKYWAYTNRKTHQLITINWDLISVISQ